MSRRRRNPSEPEAPTADPAPEAEPEYVPPADGPAGEDLAAIVVAVDPTFPALRAEYDRLAAEVTRAKPDAPGYKALREAKRRAFAAWYTAAHP